MGLDDAIGLTVAVLLAGYLVYALVAEDRPKP